MTVTDTHVYFYGGPFSNWAPAPFKDQRSGLTFANSEQGFIWNKAHFFCADDFMMSRIEDEQDPEKVKKLGRAISGFDEAAWTCVRLGMMTHINYLKYSQNPDLKETLLDTGDRTLVEASPYDAIWGIKLGEHDPLILNKANWRGLNLLGISLGQVRRMLRAS